MRRRSDDYVTDLRIVKDLCDLGRDLAKSVGMLLMSDRGAMREIDISEDLDNAGKSSA